MADFPVTPEALTPQWLSEALGFPVQGFEVARFGEGAGMIAMVTRVLLTTGPGNPASVIAKFPTPNPTNRSIARTYSMYAREVMFYQGIVDQVAIRAPRCFFAAIDPATEDFVMLLEDLGHLRLGDQVAGCTLAEARAVLSAVAGLHASTWRTTRFPRVISHNNPAQRDGMIYAFEVGWPAVNARFPELIPDSARVAGEKMTGAVGRLLEEMCRDPVCLTHVDVRLDNLFFDGDEVVFLDWQSVCTSAPEQDVAYFITQSVPPSVRGKEDLVAYYHTELAGHGVEYDLARCRERYRLCALYLMCFAVSIAGQLDPGNERGQALGRVLLGNAMSALDEMDAFALL
ncbi:MAG: phosphotransferase [Gammaproteobacteria bacterium]|nr:phosphotransferase [Gammaproteobacteria bacterium]MDE0364630.1 phosphotransferase [Gammaproteobacteria bacterium]